MVGALVLGFVAGVIARVLMPGDVFRKMSGPASWGVSILLGVAGALLGWVIFAWGLGWGDDYVFDWGGIWGAVIGSLIVLAFANWYMRRRPESVTAATPAAVPPAPPTDSVPPSPTSQPPTITEPPMDGPEPPTQVPPTP